MVRDITDAERRELERLLRGTPTTTTSRFAPSVVEATVPRSRFSQALQTGKKAGKLALSGKAFAAWALPGVEEEDIEKLPGPVRFAIDSLLSPVGLASLVAAPITGGGSIAAKVGLGKALSVKPLAVRSGVELAGRIATDLAAAGIATGASKAVDKALPEDMNPKLRTALTIGAGLAGGIGSATAISRSVKPALKGTIAASAIERGDMSLPKLQNLIEQANDLPDLSRFQQNKVFVNPVTRTLMQGLNPSKNATTQLEKLGIVTSQQKWSIDYLAKTYVAAHFPDQFKDLYIRNGEALVKGKRVNWVNAITDNYDDLEPAQKALATRYKEALNTTIDTYNKNVPDQRQLSELDIWKPRFDRKGKLLVDTDVKWKEFNDTAQGMRLTSKELSDPSTILHVYAKTAMEARLKTEFEDAITPMLRSVDDVLGSFGEGKVLKDQWYGELSRVKLLKGQRDNAIIRAKAAAAARRGNYRTAREIEKRLATEAEENRQALEALVYKLPRFGPDTGDFTRPGSAAVGRLGEAGVQNALPGLADDITPLSTPIEPLVPRVPHSMRMLESDAKRYLTNMKAEEKALRAKRNEADKLLRDILKGDIPDQVAVREHLQVRNSLDLEFNEINAKIAEVEKLIDGAKLRGELSAAEKAAGLDPVATITSDLKKAQDAERIARQAWSKYKQRTTVGEAPLSVWVKDAEGTVGVSKFRRGYLVDETGEVESLRRWTQNQVRGGAPLPVFNELQMTADAARFFSASLDASGPFINLLPMLFLNPGAWGKAIAGNWRALTFDPDYQLRYLAKNYDDITEMVAHGVASADIEQFISAARGGLGHRILNPTSRVGNAVAKIPREAFGRAQVGYETGLLIARAEAWKAFKQDPSFMTAAGAPDLRRIADIVRETTGAWDSAYFGVAPTQRALESIIFFSPRMFRSILALGADAMRPWTPEGAAAAHTILRLMSAGTGLFLTANAALGVLQGKTEAQIAKDMEESANPINGRQFMSLKVGDQWYGIGGQIRAMAQMLARATSDDDTEAGKDNNPLWDFFSGRLGPAARGGLQLGEYLTGDDWAPFEKIETFPDWMTAQAEGFLPFYAQNALQEDGLPGLLKPSLAIDIAGLSSRQRTSTDILDSAAFQRYGIQWKELTGLEQEAVRADYPELEEKANELLSNEDLAYRTNIQDINTRTTETLVAVNNARMSQQDKRERIEETLRDRWLANKTTAENFDRASGIGAADTPKRQVLDAYYNTFKEAGIGPEGTTQTDWDRWEELQVELDSLIQSGAFGDPARARAYIDDRRKFELPPELKWYTDAKQVLEDKQYWEQKDVAFKEVANIIHSQFPDVNSARELEVVAEEAELAGNRALAARAARFVQLVDSRTQNKRKLLKFRSKELRDALTILGR